jgi:uncharacterized protein (DUF58 family)
MTEPTAASPPPRWSRRWLAGITPVPTWRAAGLIGVGAVVSGIGPSAIGVLIPVAVIAAVVILDAVLAPSPWRIPVARRLPRLLALDGEAEVVWVVANPTSRNLAVAIADEFPPSLGASRRRIALSLAPRARGSATATLRPRRRGTFRPTVLTVRVRGPLRLATRQADRDLPGHMEVHPRFRSRAEAEQRIRRGRILEHGRRSARGRGAGTEFEALREYVQGDAFRHIDWSATARAGHPIVRTYRVERDQTVLVLLDCGRVVAGSVEEVPRLDHGMDATLALATVATALGDRVGLIAYGGGIRRVLTPRRDTQQLRRLSRELHTLEPELAASDHLGAVHEVLTRVRRRALIVVITDLAPGAADDGLLPVLPPLLRTHRVVVASVRDPELGLRLRRSPSGAIDAYTAAGAATVVGGREELSARLRGMGVEVVDQPPRRFAASVADAYLDAKTGGGW